MTEPIPAAFRILRAVNRNDNEAFQAAIKDGLSPAVIVVLCHVALGAGADQSGGSVEAWLAGVENELTAIAKSK